VAELRRLKTASPMVDTLATDARKAQGDFAAALKLYREARMPLPAQQGPAVRPDRRPARRSASRRRR
jgi:hypothetical protein